MRTVESSHACGARTRVVIPAVLSPRAVRRVRCEGCGERYETESVEEVTRRRLPHVSLPRFDPSSRAWQIASVPVAAALVVGGLLLLQGDDEPAELNAPGVLRAGAEAAEDSPAVAAGNGPKGADVVRSAAEIVRGAHYSLALPRGWSKSDPPAGATFAATATDGEADATLWIEENPKLGFPAFIDQSLEQLQSLAPEPKVVSRVAGPTPQTTVVRLAADSAPEQPHYEVVLRSAGPYRYYLALTTYPHASGETAGGVQLLANSLTPEVDG